MSSILRTNKLFSNNFPARSWTTDISLIDNITNVDKYIRNTSLISVGRNIQIDRITIDNILYNVDPHMVHNSTRIIVPKLYYGGNKITGSYIYIMYVCML